MMKLFFILILVTILTSCHHSDIPDVTDIKVELKVQRFEKDFFSIDTTKILQELKRLRQSYPTFINVFRREVLGFTDGTPEDTLTKYVHLFIRDYRFAKDSVEKKFPNFDEPFKAIHQALQFVKYYFPDYKLPTKVITFVGPFDGYSGILSYEALAVGLQLHLGKNFSFYQSDLGRDLFPDYISQKFEPAYIPVNCIKNIIDDLYPDKSAGKALIEQMIEKGKRLYLMDKFLPYTAGNLKIGYTETQLTDCYKNEAVIWDFFLTNDLLNKSEQDIVKNYVEDSPKTQELEGSPGNLGSFSGWQIIKKYMTKNPKVTLKQLMEMDDREVYAASRYKP